MGYLYGGTPRVGTSYEIRYPWPPSLEGEWQTALCVGRSRDPEVGEIFWFDHAYLRVGIYRLGLNSRVRAI